MIETQFFSTYFLPSVLALIMFGMGMSLTAGDFRNIFLQPRAVVIGLFCQMLVLPLMALGIALVSGLPPEYQVGIVLIAACPGGAISNLLSYLLRGNVALSVSMTVLNSFITIITIPLVVNVALSAFMGTTRPLSMPVLQTVTQILLITVIPCVAGILVRRWKPQFAAGTQRPLKIAMPVLLAIAMLAAIFLEKKPGIRITAQQYVQVLPWALLLNVTGMVFGWLVAGWLRLGRPNQLTIGLEVGLQNSGLAIAVATSAFLLNDPRLAVPASTYALFSFFTAVIFGLLINRQEVRLRDLFRRRSKDSVTK
ncbi:MAG: bile acid:sodium symporter family protein [Bacteroidota bacterium]